MLALVKRVVFATVDESCDGDLVSRFLPDVEGERTGVEVVMVVLMRVLVLGFDLAVRPILPFCLPDIVVWTVLPFPGFGRRLLNASVLLVDFLLFLVGRKLESSSSSSVGESGSGGMSNSVAFVGFRSLAVRRLFVGIMAACNSSVVINGAGFT